MPCTCPPQPASSSSRGPTCSWCLILQRLHNNPNADSSTSLIAPCPHDFKKQFNVYTEDKETKQLTKWKAQKPKGNDLYSEQGGYRAFQLKDLAKWVYCDTILTKDNKCIHVGSNAKLPVSCIEASHHVLNCMYGNKALTDWTVNSTKNLTLYASFARIDGSFTILGETKGSQDLGEQMNSLVANDYLQTFPQRIVTGEGILVLNLEEKEYRISTMHVVVVVAHNPESHEIIVIERNAGKLSGESKYTDEHWLLNKYAGAEGFRESMGIDGEKNPYYVARLTISKPINSSGGGSATGSTSSS